MKKIQKALSRLLACVTVSSVLLTSVYANGGNPFRDVQAGADYAEAVSELSEAGIITGDDKGNFNPNNTITRAEAATIICRMLGVENEAKSIKRSVFADVPSNHWAAGYIAKASELGIIGGYGNGNFGPNDPVTYEQVVKMLMCAWGYESLAIEEGGWPNGYIAVAVDFGILNDVSYSVGSPAPRSAVAMICYNTLSIAPADYLVEE